MGWTGLCPWEAVIYCGVSAHLARTAGGERRMTEQVTTAWDQRFSSAARGMRFSALRRMSALIERPVIISFAPGQPSPDTFPVEAFGKILEEILAREGAASFQYILPRGLGPLLAAIREYASAKGITAAASEVL